MLGFNATLTAEVISWRSVTHVFPGSLKWVLTQLFFPKPPTTFLACFCRGERRKYAKKKSHLNRGSNSQPPGHESDTLTTEPPWLGPTMMKKEFENIVQKGQNAGNQHFLLFQKCFLPYFKLIFQILTHSHTMTPFDTPRKQAFWKQAISPFPTVFSTRLDSFPPFSSNLKLSSANSFSLEESKICCLEMG